MDLPIVASKTVQKVTKSVYFSIRVSNKPLYASYKEYGKGIQYYTVVFSCFVRFLGEAI